MTPILKTPVYHTLLRSAVKHISKADEWSSPGGAGFPTG